MGKKLFLIIINLIFMLIQSISFGQVYINEFCASNASIVEDHEFSDFADWIELYNAGPETVNLSGYYLTDNLNNPDKWLIDIAVNVPSGGFVIIWADGRNIQSSGLHANFKLSQEGEEIGLYSPELELLDSIRYTLQAVDISQGRISDGNSEWVYFKEPTPGSSNLSDPYFGFVSNKPEFSKSGGFYEEPLTIELSTIMDGTIRYTTDGSEPTESSAPYTNPIQVNTTTVIRARVFKPDYIPGKVVTQSYFLNEDFEIRNLPVVSIATDPDNFWDEEKGIYVQSFKPSWEVPINIELFENNGSDRAAFNLTAGTKINGLYSWQLPQKMLGIYFRKQYGETKLEYPLFFDKSRSTYENFALRASGSDWSYTLFRDILGQHATYLNMDIETMAFRPCIVYVNGEYLGIHNIREKVDDDYIVCNAGIESGTFDLVENENFAEAGDLDAYNHFHTLLSKDLSIQSNFDTVAELMDIENFTDYICTELCDENRSIDHNVMAWKPKENGKWRWVLMDLDRGFFYPNDHLIGYYAGKSVLPFGQLLQNESYKLYFGQRLADHIYTSFHPDRINKLIDEHSKAIENEIPYHVERWLGTTSVYGNAMPSVDYWHKEVEKLRTFARARPGCLLNNLQSYGFDPPRELSITVLPLTGGFIKINNLIIPGTEWIAKYPGNLTVTLTAFNKPGYIFNGWALQENQVIIHTDDEWRYLDNGSDQDIEWIDEDFNDSSWKTGIAEFGYGDGDENTIIDYGGNSSDKHITTYFRKTFTLNSEYAGALRFMINLLCDDGAIIYLNEKEVARINMPEGPVNYQTTALTTISDTNETRYQSFSVSPDILKLGSNTIAVEVHQAYASSSDISFNMELIALKAQTNSYLSTETKLEFTLSENKYLVAVYEPSGECILPDTINEDLTLDISCSPYLAAGDVVVNKGATLIIQPGVEILMPKDACIFVYGRMKAIGNESKRIQLKLNPQYEGSSWGALCFLDSPDTSEMDYVTIEGASHGPLSANAVAAISAFHANLRLDNLIIEDVNRNPISSRYSDIVLTNSTLHSEITGDLVNVKYGKAYIENCEFRGNTYPDTDAIDYDDVTDGVIRKCKIYNFFGSNSDAIDIGEKAANITIDSNLIYNITDKGISVGQRSTAVSSNNIFVNCNLGLGLKDSCHTKIDHCTFYNVGIPVACYEKNIGDAGGNAIVTNSILSNSVNSSYLVDEKSSLSISSSLSDNDILPENNGNIFGDPQFINPTLFDFRLEDSSPAKEIITTDNQTITIGSLFHDYKGESGLIISGIYYYSALYWDKSEFLMLYNPNNEELDVSGYEIKTAVNFVAPEGTSVGPNEYIFVVKDISNPPSISYTSDVFEWTSGNLANEGEPIILTNKYGIVQDKVEYLPDFPWPSTNDSTVLILKDARLDNHFAENWTTESYASFVGLQDSELSEILFVYPNPITDIANIYSSKFPSHIVSVYNIAGKLMTEKKLDSSGFGTIDFSTLDKGIYFIKVGNQVSKVLVL